MTLKFYAKVINIKQTFLLKSVMGVRSPVSDAISLDLTSVINGSGLVCDMEAAFDLEDTLVNWGRYSSVSVRS